MEIENTEKKTIMEIAEQNIRSTTPGSKECTQAIQVYTALRAADREEAKFEAEMQLRRDTEDNNLIIARDNAHIKQDELEHQRRKDWIDVGLNVAKLCGSALLAVGILRMEANGTPLLSLLGKQMTNNVLKTF